MIKELIQIFRFINAHPLAGRHKIKAYRNFIEWQVSQTFSPGLVVRAYVGNTKLLLKKGLKGGTGNIYTGLHEFSDMGFLLHFLRKEDLFLDIGANIGCYTVLASGYIGARSIAVEPVPATFDFLHQNITINGIGEHAKILNCGMGSAESTLFFTKGHDDVNHVVLNPDITSRDLVEVAVTSVDILLKGKVAPALLKIDVEGFEQEVINGANYTLKDTRLKAIIIELIGAGERYGYVDENIHIILLKEGFSPFAYNPLKRKLTPASFGKTNNTIYIRDIDYVTTRITTAPEVELFSEKF